MSEIDKETYQVTFTKCAKTGQRLSQVWRNPKTGKIDNPYGPAEIIYHETTGSPQREVFRENGKITRHDGPAIIAYDETGNVRRTARVENDLVHAINQPSQIFYDQSGEVKRVEYHKNGLPILQVNVIR